MKIDLEKMGREDLLDLRAKVDDALGTLEEREREAARKAAEEVARQHGFSLSDLGIGGGGGRGRKRAKSAGTKNPPRYRNPDNPSQTWSGRGRQPQWFKEAVEAGIPRERLAI
ncbi:MAG: H-NS histone family protein [Paracoccaceae bacterium]|jgi:DNA-binding protein H-NS|nr:H-NS histone family protein [Paracoccaceae bacterium]